MIFAFFTQMYFIQPIVRTLFKVIFAKDIKARSNAAEVDRPIDEPEAIADIFRRIDEIQSNLEHERRQRKKLAVQTGEISEKISQENHREL